MHHLKKIYFKNFFSFSNMVLLCPAVAAILDFQSTQKIKKNCKGPSNYITCTVCVQSKL